MNKNYKIDIANGCHISEEDAKNSRARGHKLWEKYFIERENFSQKEAGDLSQKAQLTLAVAPSFETFRKGLLLEQRELLGLDD